MLGFIQWGEKSYYTEIVIFITNTPDEDLICSMCSNLCGKDMIQFECELFKPEIDYCSCICTSCFSIGKNKGLHRELLDREMRKFIVKGRIHTTPIYECEFKFNYLVSVYDTIKDCSIAFEWGFINNKNMIVD